MTSLYSGTDRKRNWGDFYTAWDTALRGSELGNEYSAKVCDLFDLLISFVLQARVVLRSLIDSLLSLM
jgi:hypothetical protein